MKKSASIIVILVLVLAACRVEKPGYDAGRIDAYLSQLEREQGFSGAVLIAHDGNILLSKGYGMADREVGTPNTPQTRYRIHWLTMPFTAMAILLLGAEGKLNVRDPICQYVPDCPDYWQGITIHHLLTHSSGVSDWIQPWDREADIPSNGLQRVEQIRYEPPYFDPGDQFRYSENAYIILGYIIETLSGLSYEEFLQEHIFGPLGMWNSGYEGVDVAPGYDSAGAKVPDPDLLFRYSASGLFSSVEDLYLWDQALYPDGHLPQYYQDKMFTGYIQTPSLDIENSEYGYGWFVGEVLGCKVIAHGGMMRGYTSMLMRFPNERLTIIVLRNYGLLLYDRLEIELAQMVLGEK